MTLIHLDGCTTQPLLSYLKALGVLAAVAEQLDPDAAGAWRAGRFQLHLSGNHNADDLLDFFASQYAPPPLISPWNSRGGFRTDLEKLEAAEQRIAKLEDSTDPRLAGYRKAIAVGRDLWQQAAALELFSLEPKPGKKKKELVFKSKSEFIRLCRARFPDEALGWIDACAVLVGEDAEYPALLGGTGGNLGSGDLSSNAHQAALWLVSQPDVRDYVAEALLARPRGVKLIQLLPGQFDPGGTGGVNMGPGEKLANPVEFLLALHGACLFASGVARRLSGVRAASIPFTVRVSPGVVRTMAEGETVRAELWLPEWERPMTLSELRVLLAEGRAQWSGAQSTTSLDFARAAASLGVDRQITSFTRFLIAQRNGDNNFAVPVGRFRVQRRRGVELTSAIDPFLRRVDQIPKPTQAVVGTAAHLRRSIFALAERDTVTNARGVLGALYELERAVGRSAPAREKVTQPFHGLRAVDWLPFLVKDQTTELRVAIAIASQRDPWWEQERGPQAAETSAVPIWCRPVRRNGVRQRDGHAQMQLVWSETEPLVDLLGPDPRRALREGWRVRALRCAQHPRIRTGEPTEAGEPVAQPEGEVGTGPSVERGAERLVLDTPGIDGAFGAALPCPIDDHVAYGAGDFDDDEFVAWLRALVMLDWSGVTFDHLPWREDSGSGRTAAALGPVFSTNAPFFSRYPIKPDVGDGSWIRFRPSSAHVAAVARGDGAAALDLASRRLRQYGVELPVGVHATGGLTRSSVLDAVLVPMTARDLYRVLRCANPRLPTTENLSEEETA